MQVPGGIEDPAPPATNPHPEIPVRWGLHCSERLDG
jgi:hypothetical protein